MSVSSPDQLFSYIIPDLSFQNIQGMPQNKYVRRILYG